MHKSILVAGIAGTGKSTVCAELKRRGYRSHDLERIRGLFHMTHKKTGKVIRVWDNRDLSQIKQMEWVCDTKMLERIVRSDRRGLTFYCGAASNIGALYSLFDQILLLRASPKVLNARLRTRTTNDFARDPKVRRWYLASKDKWEDGVLKAGATIVDADQTLRQVTDEILSEVR